MILELLVKIVSLELGTTNLSLRQHNHYGFHQVCYEGGIKPTVSGVFEDIKFKISEGSDQNW